MNRDFIFSSESVTAGHPDKLCDQISDAIVDAYLLQDPYAKVSAETAIANGIVFLACRFNAKAHVDVAEVARSVIEQAGYDARYRFNAQNCTILTNLQEAQRRHFYQLDERELTGIDLDAMKAMHQANAFGFACDDTPDFMPLPLWLAHRLARRLHQVHLQTEWLAADAQVQVGVEYHAGRPRRIQSLSLLASHHGPRIADRHGFEALLFEDVLNPIFSATEWSPDARTHIAFNPYGDFEEGGPHRHSGLTGRKTQVDTYGEYSRHSGAALSGKDPLRIDRVGAYAARYAAKHVVAAGLARACEVLLSYTIGEAGPVSVSINTFGTAQIDESLIQARLLRVFDFRLGAIVRDLKLRHLSKLPKAALGYRDFAVYGHMGRGDLQPPWEQLDRLEALTGR